MNAERANEVLQSKMKCDVFYEEKPVWIQDVRDNIAKIGFLDGSKEKNVYLEDLYERSLYQ